MGIIYTHQKSKQKKKPGWQKEKAEHDAWLSRVNSMRLFDKPVKITKQSAKTTSITAVSTLPAKFVRDQGTKKVPRPELEYMHDENLLKRELAARERKFTVAPVYNKGGDVLITDELLKDIAAGSTRRR